MLSLYSNEYNREEFMLRILAKLYQYSQNHISFSLETQTHPYVPTHTLTNLPIFTHTQRHTETNRINFIKSNNNRRLKSTKLID